MKRILSIMAAFLLTIISVHAQQNDSRNVKKLKRPSGNPGDPRNARAAQSDSLSKGDGKNLTAPTGTENEIIGEENHNNAPQEELNGSDNYRKNRPKGNPNNRNVNEGSNNQTTEGETTESSTADGEKINEGAASTDNSGVVTHEETSGSGSPSILSDEEGNARDGTNNVQRAKPNMAGSPVNGIHMPLKMSDTNRKKLKKGAAGQSLNQQGQRMKQKASETINDQAKETQVSQDPYVDDATYQKQMEDQMKEATSVESTQDKTKSENKKDKKSRRKKSKS